MSKGSSKKRDGSRVRVHGDVRRFKSVRRHETRSAAWECCSRQRVAIEQYVARHVAPAMGVLHEIRSELVHVDVHVVPPDAQRPYWFLFTTGMSALPMHVPAHMGLIPRAELSVMLPAWWQVDLERWRRDPTWFWPIRELIDLARYPHRQRTWLGEGHTIAHSDPPRPYDHSTQLSGMLIRPFSLVTDEESSVIDEYVATELLALWPLHADELDYKRTSGARALCTLLDAAGVTAILDPRRPSALAFARESNQAS